MAYFQMFPYAHSVAWPAAIVPVSMALRLDDPTAALVAIEDGIATVKSDAPWTDARIAAAQARLEAPPAAPLGDPVTADLDRLRADLARVRAAVTLLASSDGRETRRVLELLRADEGAS
jgi:hypothetical protein